jgi:hypothetical protein
MIARVVLVVLIVGIATPVAFAMDDELKTIGFPNGRAWSKMGDLGRLMYLQGFNDAIIISVIKGSADRKALQTHICTCTFGEASEGITALYASDPAFARVPVYVMQSAFSERTKGASKDQVEKMITDFLAGLPAMEREFQKPHSN